MEDNDSTPGNLPAYRSWMGGREKNQAELLARLSGVMSKGDAETIIEAALRPQDFMAKKMTEIIWEGLPAAAKAALGETVEAFIESSGLGKPAAQNTAELISPNAQKLMRRRKSGT